LGENGAGKTTLMNILYGIYQPDAGEIRINDRRVSIDSPKASIDHGIGMVHQHFMLIQNHTVIENIALGYAHPACSHRKKFGSESSPFLKNSISISTRIKKSGSCLPENSSGWRLSKPLSTEPAC
jgi:ABC-type uncharacterized transport system ATPase subunit